VNHTINATLPERLQQYRTLSGQRMWAVITPSKIYCLKYAQFLKGIQIFCKVAVEKNAQQYFILSEL